jgi:hypothetical protein
MIWVGCFEKLLEVIYGLSCLAFDITHNSGDELLNRVTDVFIVITFVAPGGDHDSLGPLLWPPLVASSALPCTLVDCFG